LTDFSQIRPFHDSEVSEILGYIKDNPTMRQLLHFGFPKRSEEEQIKLLLSCKKIRDLGRMEFKKILLFKRLNPIHIKQIALFDANWVDILN